MSKILVSMALVVAMVVGIPGLLPAQTTSGNSTYIFPRVDAPGLELVISNISTVNAVARVTFFDPAGVTALSLRLNVAAGTQTIVDDNTTGLGSFLGSAIVESATPLSVTVTRNVPGSLDTAVPASSGSEVIIPFVRAGTFADTTVSIFNSSLQVADVLLALGKPNGALVNGTRITLGPRENRHLSLNSLQVTLVDLDTASFVLVRSLGSVLLPARSVSAVGMVTNFETHGVFRQDAAVVQGLPTVTLGSSTVLPMFISGFGYFTDIQVTNAASIPQSITLTALGANGAPVPAAANPVAVMLSGRGTVSENIATLFGLSAEAVGSVSISGGAALTAVGVIGQEGFPNLGVIDPAGPAGGAFGFQLRSLSRNTSANVSFFNPSSVDTGVALTFVTNAGATVSQAQMVVPAGTLLTRTLAEIMPEAEGSGFIYLASGSPIQVGAIEGSADGSVLSRLPASPVTTAFNPRSQDRFLAVGTARISGIPIPGATVRLAGPALGTKVTDSVGAFVFKDIPPGNYTVSIQMAGVTFTPTSISFTITDQNQRDIDFNGVITAPTLTSVAPPSVLVGTAASVTVTTTGGPFIPTSEIVFDGAVIPTVFVNENTLTGTISPAAFTLARVTAIFVQNRVGPTVSPSNTLSFVIGNPAPVLTGLEGVPMEIIAGYPGFTVTVNGTGFNEGGTIEFNGVPRPFVWESSTRVQAFIGPEDLAVGRIASLTATNPSPTIGASNALSVTVYNPVAGLLSITPSMTEIKIEPNSTGLRLQVDGFLFKPGATVLVDGEPALNSTWISETRLIADIPPDSLESGGSFPVTVLNPPPNLGSSEVQPLIVQNLIPRLASIDTGTLTFTPGVSEAETVPVEYIGVLHGSNFGKSYIVAMIEPPGVWPSCNPQPPGSAKAVPAQIISSTEVVVTLAIKCRGNFQLYVSSPQSEPGGGISQIVSFDVIAPTAGPIPILAALVPPVVPARITFTLTINGNNFQPGALVNLGTAILTPNPADITATTIRVQVPFYYVEKGIVPVTVTNPGTGGTSTRLLLSVN